MIVWIVSFFEDEVINLAKDFPKEDMNDFPISEMATTESSHGLFYYGY